MPSRSLQCSVVTDGFWAAESSDWKDAAHAILQVIRVEQAAGKTKEYPWQVSSGDRRMLLGGLCGRHRS